MAGGFYHAMARGNERKAIYLDDQDCAGFLDLLARVVRRYRWQCLAYCLMPNHYHLLVRTPEPNLSRGMRVLNGGHAARFNIRHDRVGHLFQGRFRSVLIGDSVHLLTALRYVIRNPVASGACERPEAWPWSSFRLTMLGEPTATVAVSETLAMFGHDGSAQRRFVSFVSVPDEPKLDGLPAHDLEFCVEPSSMSRPSVATVLAANPGVRGIAMAHREYGYSLREIAGGLDISRQTVARRLVAFESTEMLEGAN